MANNYQSVQRSLPKVAYSVFMMDFLLGALVFNVVAFISCARYPYLACSPFSCHTRAKPSLVHWPCGRYGYQLRNVGRR